MAAKRVQGSFPYTDPLQPPPPWTPSNWGSDELINLSIDSVTVDGSSRITQWDGKVTAIPNDPSILALYEASYASLNGEPAAHFDNGSNDGGYQWPTSGMNYSQYTFMFILDIASTSWQYLTYDDVLSDALDLDGSFRWLGGGGGIFGAGFTGPAALMCLCNSDTGALSLYKNGNVLVGTTSATLSALDGPTHRTFYGKTDGNVGPRNGTRGVYMGCLNRLATADDRASFFEYADWKYGAN